jgi:hypothetical protein
MKTMKATTYEAPQRPKSLHVERLSAEARAVLGLIEVGVIFTDGYAENHLQRGEDSWELLPEDSDALEFAWIYRGLRELEHWTTFSEHSSDWRNRGHGETVYRVILTERH